MIQQTFEAYTVSGITLGSEIKACSLFPKKSPDINMILLSLDELLQGALE